MKLKLQICPAIAAHAVLLAGATRADNDDRGRRGHYADEDTDWDQNDRADVWEKRGHGPTSALKLSRMQETGGRG